MKQIFHGFLSIFLAQCVFCLMPVYADDTTPPTLPSTTAVVDLQSTIDVSDQSYPCYYAVMNSDDGVLAQRTNLVLNDLRAVTEDLDMRPEELVLRVKQNVSALRMDLAETCGNLAGTVEACANTTMDAAKQQVILSACAQQSASYLKFTTLLARELLFKNIYAKQTYFLVRRLEAFTKEMKDLHEVFASGLVQYFADALRTMDTFKRTPLPKK